ncbi:MAG: hypothetical protein U0992_21395 [Planctomycetaceae bacterium]
MRKFLTIGILALQLAASSGCVVPIWSANPDVRARELIYQSETHRQIPEIWERIWFLDAPDFATPYRTHGGVI